MSSSPATRRRWITTRNTSNAIPNREIVKVYTDEGISGTNTKHRIGFNEMIADAMSGKIDLIVTKSVSRFARNTVDGLVMADQMVTDGRQDAILAASQLLQSWVSVALVAGVIVAAFIGAMPSASGS